MKDWRERKKRELTVKETHTHTHTLQYHGRFGSICWSEFDKPDSLLPSGFNLTHSLHNALTFNTHTHFISLSHTQPEVPHN